MIKRREKGSRMDHGRQKRPTRGGSGDCGAEVLGGPCHSTLKLTLSPEPFTALQEQGQKKPAQRAGFCGETVLFYGLRERARKPARHSRLRPISAAVVGSGLAVRSTAPLKDAESPGERVKVRSIPRLV